MASPVTAHVIAGLVASSFLGTAAAAGQTEDPNACTFGYNVPDLLAGMVTSCTFHCHAGNRIAVFANGPLSGVRATCGGLSVECSVPLLPNDIALAAWTCSATSGFGAAEGGGTCESIGLLPPQNGQCQNFGI